MGTHRLGGQVQLMYSARLSVVDALAPNTSQASLTSMRSAIVGHKELLGQSTPKYLQRERDKLIVTFPRADQRDF